MFKLKIIILIILIAIIAGLINISQQIFGEVEIPKQKRAIKIEQGQSVKQITKNLADQGLIKSDFWFRTQVWLKGRQKEFMAGVFDLPEKINTDDLIKLFTTSARKETKTIKILEGWGINDIAQYLKKQNIDLPSGYSDVGRDDFLGSPVDVDSGQFTGVVAGYRDFSSEFPFLDENVKDNGLEGYLFPDTYEIFADSSVDDVVRKMLNNFDKKVTKEMRDEVKRQGKSFYDVLIMASIIEAEVPNENERPIVSDIFWSRLESRVAMQSCATLNYAINGDNPALTLEQLEIDSPYNSYMYRGLPPTPIGNPGISSIMAAIYPENTDYFYFLSTPEGKTIFSRTLDEHNTAKVKYLK